MIFHFLLFGKFYNIIYNIKNKINNILYYDNYLKNNNINYVISSRIKTKEKIIYKIFNKKKIPQDIFGIRIIYSNPNNFNDTITAYNIQNSLKKNFFECHYFYDDYIENPKQNLYQSIHLYFFYLILFEIQIRNEKMHNICINGSASNYY